VADDGSGFPIGTAGRLDSYGITGMRERAASIGATLEIASSPGVGTRVRCELNPDLRDRRRRVARSTARPEAERTERYAP
jgi:nitrate/nitrite-specific signal transduction histidine kinase